MFRTVFLTLAVLVAAGSLGAITVDDAAATLIARSSAAHVEHLEAYGVAAACAARGIPFGSALGVANHVGARAREEWRAHHRKAAAAAEILDARPKPQADTLWADEAV